MTSRMRVLHLEDNSGDALLVRTVLEAGGLDCELVQVDSRERFLAALDSEEFDLVLSDYALPAFDGIAALQIARERRPDTPFIFVSGSMGEELAIETLKAGATDYVLKDRLSRLLPSIERALSEARERRERRASDAALRESEARFRSMADHAPVLIWLAGADGRVTFLNRAWLDFTGRSLEQEAGDGWSQGIHPEDREGCLRIYRSCFERRSAFREEYRLRRADGEYRWILTSGVPRFTAGGEFAGYIGSGVDITERTLLEAQLRQSQKMEAIGTLAGGIAHDFNNLLTSILGYSELALQGLDAEHPLRENLEEIKKAGERAAALTRQLLAFSRKQVLMPVVLDLDDVVTELEKMLKRLIGEHVALASVTDPAGHWVRADRGQIEQVIVNLVVNARDAMPAGGTVTVETRHCEVDEHYAREHTYAMAGSYVCLSVSDTGVGMDSATKLRIFEPFFTTKDQGKGTGLGLSTVYGIVKQSGGHIEVYSEPGQGTSFKIYLPRVEETGEVVAPAAAEVPRRGSETVLLVEDEKAVRALARRTLEAQGYAVLEASSAEEASQVADGHVGTIHLMMTDTVMPGASGPELARRLSSSRPEMKVLFVSGYADAAIVRQGLIDGAQSFLQKPFSPAALARKVCEVLEGA